MWAPTLLGRAQMATVLPSVELRCHSETMAADLLHRPLYTADLLVNALAGDDERPLLNLLDGPTLTVREVRQETSRFVQALAGLGVGRGTRVGLISSNCPEVLHV